MNGQTRVQVHRKPEHTPLFASMWVTLFLVLRRELFEPRAAR
jgi:hypothetical protein